MASIRVGGDPEQYMEAPTLSGGGSGGASGRFFSKLFDLLGIHTQVAEAPKGADDSAPKPTSAPAPGKAVVPQVLKDVESIFQPSLTSDRGARYLDSIKPIKMFDPNDLM